MRSSAVLNITGARTLELLKGAVLWRTYTNAPEGRKQALAQSKWRLWLDGFVAREGTTEREVFEAVQFLSTSAYQAALQISANSTKDDSNA